MIDAASWTRLAGPAGADVDALFAALYGDLCRLARREKRRSGAHEVLGTGTLVHEAWLDLRRSPSPGFSGPGQLLTYAARMMRGLAIDRLRARQAQRRGGDCIVVPLDTLAAGEIAAVPDWQALREALAELEGIEPALAEVVDLKFFCGFTLAEIATMRGASERTVQRQWEKARGLLFRNLAGPVAHGEGAPACAA